MIAILDYGAGNLRSVQKAFEYLNYEAIITNDKNIIDAASHIVLPGVGAFGDAKAGLEKAGLAETVIGEINKKKPFLGICVGLQLLFETSEESPDAEGLGIFKGSIRKIPDTGLKIPQMGWNSLSFTKDCPIFDGLKQDEFVYFVHSYYPVPVNKEEVTATTQYGETLEIAVQRNNIFATQFHPEKSGRSGLKILDNFAKLERNDFI